MSKIKIYIEYQIKIKIIKIVKIKIWLYGF